MTRGKNGDRERARITSSLFAAFLEFGHNTPKILDRHIGRAPAVAVVDNPLQSLWLDTAHDDGWMGLLYRFGIGPESIEIDKLAMKRGFVFSPNGFYREDSLAQHFPPPVETRAVVFHFCRIPPPADSKDDAPVRQAVEGSHFFRRGDRIPLDHQTDAGGKLETFRHGAGGHQGNKGITHV